MPTCSSKIYILSNSEDLEHYRPQLDCRRGNGRGQQNDSGGFDSHGRYTAASTGDSRLVLFMNQFDTMEQASKAEEAAIYNTTKTGNDGKLKLWLSVETEGYAAFPADTCITESSKGQWLAADVWKFLDPASVDPASLPPISEDYHELPRHAPLIKMIIKGSIPPSSCATTSSFCSRL